MSLKEKLFYLLIKLITDYLIVLHTLSLYVSLSFFISLSPLSVIFALSLSLSPLSLFISLSFTLSLSPLSFPLSLSLSVSVSVSLSLSLEAHSVPHNTRCNAGLLSSLPLLDETSKLPDPVWLVSCRVLIVSVVGGEVGDDVVLGGATLMLDVADI